MDIAMAAAARRMYLRSIWSIAPIANLLRTVELLLSRTARENGRAKAGFAASGT